MIRIGIVGCGYWGPNFVRNFNQIPGSSVVAICDLRQERLEEIRQLFPDIKTYNTVDPLLNDKNIDAVVISTPATTHYAVAKAALENNKHVLVEKPLSVKTADCEDLIRLARNSGKVLMVGHTFLFNPAVRKMKELLDRKTLGKLYYIHCRRTNLGPLRKDVNAVWDLCAHDIAIINYLLGNKPLKASARAARFLSHRVEDVGFITLEYPRNILVHAHVSWLDPKKIREMTIIGSKKMLVYDDTNSLEPIRVYDKKVMKKKYDRPYHDFKEFQLIITDGEVTIPKVNMTEPLKHECQHFLDSIIKNVAPLTDGKNGLETVAVLEAIDKSIKNNGKNTGVL